jgi:hypothetical protein
MLSRDLKLMIKSKGGAAAMDRTAGMKLVEMKALTADLWIIAIGGRSPRAEQHACLVGEMLVLSVRRARVLQHDSTEEGSRVEPVHLCTMRTSGLPPYSYPALLPPFFVCAGFLSAMGVVSADYVGLTSTYYLGTDGAHAVYRVGGITATIALGFVSILLAYWMIFRVRPVVDWTCKSVLNDCL